MEQSDQPREDEKRPTKALSDEPQEEFIAEKPRPSRPEHHDKNSTAEAGD